MARFVIVLPLLLLPACSDGSHGHDALAGHDDSANEWRGLTASGVAVTLHPPDPLTAGATRFRITIEDGSGDITPTADLVSPTMPVHGISRYPLRPGDTPDHWVLELEIPMEGRWTLYVNLDDGADAAPFEFDVAAADGMAAHAH